MLDESRFFARLLAPGVCSIHPYAGNPALYPPNIGLLDDPDLNPATSSALNVGIQNLADRTAYLAQTVRALGTENWYPPIATPGGGGVFGRPAWDPVNGLWLFTYLTGTVGGIQGVYGLPGSNNPAFSGILGTPITGAPAIWSVCKDPTDATTFYVAAIGLGGNNDLYVWRLDIGTGVYTQVLHDPSGVFQDAELWYFSGSLILATVAASGVSLIRISRDHGSTWSTVSITAVTGRWTLHDNGTQFIALGSQVSGGSAPPLVVTSSDGLAFTTRAITGMGATYTGLGVANGTDFGGPCWMVLARNGSARTFWRSYDAINWAQVGATLTATACADIAASGPLFVIASVDTNGTYLSYSFDGCVTWHKTQMYLPLATQYFLQSNGGQFALCILLEAVFSYVVGPSGVLST